MIKKLIIILSILLLTGCYDYIELNDLSIISMIMIDKIDNKYNVTFEILKDQKNDNNSLIITGNGYSLSKAIDDASSKTPKQAYFAHLKVLALSKKIAKDDLKNVIEYFLRAPHIRNEFYLAVIDNDNVNDILKTQNKENPIISEYILSMLKNHHNTFNNTTNNNFENILIDLFEKGKDATLPVIKLDDDNLKTTGNGLLDGYTLKYILDSNESSLLNILNNNASNTLFSFKCPNSNNNITLSIYNGDSSIYLKDNKIVINTSLMAEIEEYNCQNNLKDTDTFKLFNNYYEDILKNNMDALYKRIKLLNTDCLGIGKIIYDNKRKYNEYDWLNYDHKINVSLKINKEGLIYEVNNGN